MLLRSLNEARNILGFRGGASPFSQARGRGRAGAGLAFVRPRLALRGQLCGQALKAREGFQIGIGQG